MVTPITFRKTIAVEKGFQAGMNPLLLRSKGEYFPKNPDPREGANFYGPDAQEPFIKLGPTQELFRIEFTVDPAKFHLFEGHIRSGKTDRDLSSEDIEQSRTGFINVLAVDLTDEQLKDWSVET